MAKENPDTPKAETPFQRFQMLAGKIVRVPKDKPTQKSWPALSSRHLLANACAQTP